VLSFHQLLRLLLAVLTYLANLRDVSHKRTEVLRKKWGAFPKKNTNKKLPTPLGRAGGLFIVKECETAEHTRNTEYAMTQPFQENCKLSERTLIL